MCSYPLQAYTCFCLVPLMTHSASSINVTLKCWLRGRSRSLKMDRQIIYDLLLVCHCNYSSLSLAPFSSYLALSNIMTLKSRLGVTQCHWKWHQSIDRIEFLFVFRCNYGRILCCFRDKAARQWSKNANFFITQNPIQIFFQIFNTKCPSPWAITQCRSIAENLNSVSRVQQRHKQTTGHAIRRT